jgi:hypothetical protein
MDRPATPSYIETVAESALGAAAAPAMDSDISQLTSSSAAEEGRFAPGALLGGRYRIIGLLGRGGMGEVYRATDLALGQGVALKFLPPEAAGNPRLLERFHGEVRVARLVSHPNVCRVFDIGEVEGTPFISMEYVDGEDLASLLTRIGRLPADKALETARKLCAGLAAAHDRGVIHRDLKPQNIMMNKRGDVVIMDFGLAAITDQISGAEVRNGTPGYMAPEQLKGAAVTHRSDIYALGLVLYELFTGKRPYEAKSLQQLIDLQESAHFGSMTSVAADIDPSVEKVIRRCLDPDPQRRPGTALSVAAALPGGDPLAAALAAGETPSPEMVASAGKVEGLARKYSIPCLVAVAVCVFGATWFYGRSRAIMRAPLENPPEVLAHEARQIAASFGYTARPADSAIWLEHRGDLVAYLNKKPAPRDWDAWLAAEAPIRAVYRESPQPLLAQPQGSVERENPPPTLRGMATVTVDGNGKLLAFSAVPRGEAVDPPAGPEEVFRAAGLPMSAFHEVTPTLTPAHASDRIQAWSGMHPRLPETQITLQMASWKGSVTEVAITYPYMTAAAGAGRQSWLGRVRDVLVLAFPVVGTLLMALVARRNWTLGRIDRKGAIWVAGMRLVLGFVSWAGLVHAVPAGSMLKLLESTAADLLGSALLLWVLYLALEPTVRARYPHSMVTWNRLLAGRWLDAQVGADLLIGAAVGCAIWAAYQFIADFGPRDVIEVGGNLTSMLGTRPWIGRQAGSLSDALMSGLFVFAVICGLRRLVRYDIAAALLTAVIFTVTQEDVGGSNWKVVAPLFVALYAVLAMILMRVGLIATVSAIFYVNLFSAITLGNDWKAWYAPAGVATITLMLGLAGFAFWRSLGGRELIGGGEESPV